MGIYGRLLFQIHQKYYSQMDWEEGYENSGFNSHAEGLNTTAEEVASHAEGSSTTAKGVASHAEGSSTTAKGVASHAEGANTLAHADFAHAEGANTLAKGIASHTEGNSTVTCGNNSHAEGSHTTTGTPEDDLQGDSAHAEGYFTIAYGTASHAEGNSTNAYGHDSHAEGSFTTTGASEEPLQGASAHAEGKYTTAYGDGAHAEGHFTFAKGDNAHAEGFYTTAKGIASHAEGAHTVAEGDFSHAEGIDTQAIGIGSHTEGIGTYSKFKGAHIMGKYGEAQEAYSWFIGNGISANNKEIGAKWLASTRNMYIDGTTYIAGGTNYAEMFEVRNGTIDIGFFVTLDGEYVRKATNQDDYILGITSATPSILGNGAEMRWKDKYFVDEWGRMPQADYICSGITEKGAILNPKWNSEKIYESRIERDEWIAVGILGQIRVRDDGTCVVGGYCSPNIEGIATKSEEGYRVIKRVNQNQIIVMLK
ncbi:hypothetical protein COD14_28765 [Bacillus cereus]|nr:hypothetical protein COD14_28765 [Bacillus cereus]